MANSFWSRISRVFTAHSKVDDDILDSIEEALVESDMGVDTVLRIIDSLEERVCRDKYASLDELSDMLKDEITKVILEGSEGKASAGEAVEGRPYVILVVGVNGVGKTTTIGKLAHMYKSQGKKVILGAADTFRAAAVDQIQIWADRAGVDIVRQQMGSDPAAVAYDTVKSAVAKHSDVVIIDTAGRLHNRIDLMNELKKIRNSVSKVIPDAPDEVLLVLDASTGQNAYQQAREFEMATNINGLVLTKMDGTAKGGVAVGLVDRFKTPVRYIGIGEGIDDLKPFDADEFASALFNLN